MDVVDQAEGTRHPHNSCCNCDWFISSTMLRGVSARLLARCSNAATPAAPLASLSPLEWPARAVACSATAATTTTTNSWCFPQQQQQQAAAVRGTAWLAPASVRHYFVIPKPSWGYDEVMQLKEGRKGRNRDGLKLGYAPFAYTCQNHTPTFQNQTKQTT